MIPTMIFAKKSLTESSVTSTNSEMVSITKEKILAPIKPVNSLAATEGAQLFESNTQSLFVTNAKITPTIQAMKFASR